MLSMQPSQLEYGVSSAEAICPSIERFLEHCTKLLRLWDFSCEKPGSLWFSIVSGLDVEQGYLFVEQIEYRT